MRNVWIIAVVVLAGATQPVQAAMNARLKDGVGSPALTGLIAFAVGALALAPLALAGVGGRARLAGAASVPWWAFLGGLSLAFLVAFISVAVRQTNAAATIAAVVAGQIVAALAVDHFGWLEVERVPASPWRIAGAALVLAGMLLLQKR
jgi:transporter family-2 protein